MVGSKIPVLEVEKFKISNDGRGMECYWDEANYFSGAITTTIHASGAGLDANKQALPAASTMGWAALDLVSGSSTFTGYIPVYKLKW